MASNRRTRSSGPPPDPGPNPAPSAAPRAPRAQPQNSATAVSQELKRLRDELNALKAASNGPNAPNAQTFKAKTCPPKPWSGKSTPEVPLVHISVWLRQMYSYLTITQVSASNQPIVAASYLEGNARVTYDNHRAAAGILNAPGTMTWAWFTRACTELFGSPNLEVQARLSSN